MTDAPAPSPAPAPAPAVTPSPALSPTPAPAAISRPEYVPETYWDPTANAIKPEFGQHYTEVSKFYAERTAADEALKARKPEDIKIEVKLPDTVKLPDGMKLQIDEKDPRVPILRKIAMERGLSQDTVNDLVAFDAQLQIEAHNSELIRIGEENKKLGDNADSRKAAVMNWSKAFGFTADELNEVRLTAATAAGVTALEKIMAKASGSVPGVTTPAPPREEPKSHAERIWPDGFKQKAN